MTNMGNNLIQAVSKELVELYKDFKNNIATPNYDEHINVCINNLLYCLKYTTDNAALDFYKWSSLFFYELPVLKDRKHEIISKAKERQVELALERMEKDFSI